MKIWLLMFCLFFFIIPPVKSQRNDTIPVNPHSKALHNMYMKKRMAHNIAGWILLGSGLTLAASSFLSWANDGYNGVWEGESLFNVGCIAAIGSIPFFIIAGKNKRKAKLLIKQEPIATGYPKLKSHYTAISVRINL